MAASNASSAPGSGNSERPQSLPSATLSALPHLFASDDEFLDYVQAQFVSHGVPHTCVCFEITETTAVASLTKATQFMTALRALGCRFALDDFGIGFSSFSYLQGLPADYVKIDGSFIRDLGSNPANRALVKAIDTVAHTLGKETIAEQVEDLGSVAVLRELGVEFAQGFALGEPSPDLPPPADG